jgi:hypothetical protein
MTRPMRSCHVETRLVRTRGCGALLALMLAACVTPPTLTLAATSSWRTRRDGAALAQRWTAGAQLGWSAGTHARSDRAGRSAIEPLVAIRSPELGAPCAFDSTCSWERGARRAALLRAQRAFEGDPP